MDPTYITILVNGTNTTKVLSTAATLLYNSLGLLSFLVLLATIGIIVVVMDIALRLMGEKNHKNENQTQQQDNKQQEVNNKNISVDLKTLYDIKDSISFSAFLILLIILIAIMTPAVSADTNLYQAAMFLILLIAIASIAVLSDGHSELKKVMPKKVRKIVKITTVYSDGTTVEKEEKYEC
jgi:quinol-cytochrome oxidoreductase complex cytochrome b subunit